MDLVHRIWPREADSLDLGGSFVERLRQLSAETRPAPTGGSDAPEILAVPDASAEADGSASRAPSESAGVPAVAVSTETLPVAEAGADGAADSGAVPDATGDGREAPEATASAGETQQPQDQSTASDPELVAVTAEPSSAARAEDSPSVSNPPEPVAVAPSSQESPSPSANGDHPSQTSDAVPGPGQKLLDQFNSAVERVNQPEMNRPPETGGAHGEFDSVHRQFEADLRTRLDGALAEFERRMSSQTLIEDLTGQLEERIRKSASSIFSEVQGQAWMMHNAVAGELRAFRDQFNKEIQERVALLDRSAQQALRLKESLDQSLPKAEDSVRSLSQSGQEASARFQAASDAFTERLSVSRQELSQEVENQKAALEALARDFSQDRSRLKEELGSFQREAAAACEVLSRTAEQALQRFNSQAAEVHSRNCGELEKLAVEIEQRVLSGGLVERASEQLSRATQEMVEPSLNRIHKASEEANAAAESLTHASRCVSANLDTARQEIESRLGSLLGEQLNVIETTMTGFQQKASEDLGDLVERVVSQSTRQLDERLHGLLQDLFVSTNNQINGAARATFTTLHDGLKEVFVSAPDGQDRAEPGPSEAEPAEEAADHQ